MEAAAASASAAVISDVHCRMSFTCTPVATHDSRGKYSRSRIARISGPNNLRLLAFFSSRLSYSNERRCGVWRTFCSSSDSAAAARDQLALILEVDGVLVDAYRVGNRKAFNQAFQKLGLDCANWTEPIYNDLARVMPGPPLVKSSFLRRKSDGGEEMMLVLYFNRIGWPSSLPTSEKSAFVKSVLQEKKNAMDEFMMSKDLPFRPGVQEFIDEACDGGIPVVILTAYSKCGEKVARSIIERLGEKRTSEIKIVGWAEIEQSLYGQLVLGKGMSSGLDEQLSKEVRKAASTERQRIANEVASLLKLRVELDTSSPESLDRIIVALCVAAESVGTPVSNCIIIAGSLPGIRGSEHIGMPCIIVRNSFTARAEIPSSSAIVMDGFGEPDITISRLQCRNWS